MAGLSWEHLHVVETIEHDASTYVENDEPNSITGFHPSQSLPLSGHFGDQQVILAREMAKRRLFCQSGRKLKRVRTK
jgi:hypothetical protein